MMCDPCKQTADYDTRIARGGVAGGKRPGHCAVKSCTCQHRPSGSVKFDTGKK